MGGRFAGTGSGFRSMGSPGLHSWGSHKSVSRMLETAYPEENFPPFKLCGDSAFLRSLFLVYRLPICDSSRSRGKNRTLLTKLLGVFSISNKMECSKKIGWIADENSLKRYTWRTTLYILVPVEAHIRLPIASYDGFAIRYEGRNV